MNDVVDFAALTALIVEDHPESALLLDAVLAESGMRLVPVRTAEEARAVVQTLRPDIILCDLALPGEDGLAFVRWVRATQGDGPDAIPAVAMTAFYERYGTREVRDAGFDVVLHKPIEPEHLVRTIGLLLEGRRGGGPAKT